MKVAYVWNAGKYSGVGLRAREIMTRLRKQVEGDFDVYDIDGKGGSLKKNNKEIAQLSAWPGKLGSKTVGWWRLGWTMKRNWKDEYAVVHYTNQTLGFLVKDTEPAVITVHDLIELEDPQTRWGRLSARYLYQGITKAKKIIAVSEYTAERVREVLGVPAEKITVVYNGVGSGFYPIKSFRETLSYQKLKYDLDLPDDARVVLYVGSDHPRKNVIGALRIFAKVCNRCEKTYFIKVGAPGIREERAKLLDRVRRLGLKKSVRFLSQVTEERLNELYNLADVLLYPSRFEGFGMPPLEAFAAGTPVVTSNVTSLPEVVGDDDKYGKRAALVFDPDDIQGMVEGVRMVLEDVEVAEKMKKMGWERAKEFTWEDAASKVAKVYRQVSKL
jgi:glycosyltransferase involved in cell wall biosynthesis